MDKIRNTTAIEYSMDSVAKDLDKNSITVQGWVYSENGEPVQIDVLDENGKSLEYKASNA